MKIIFDTTSGKIVRIIHNDSLDVLIRDNENMITADINQGETGLYKVDTNTNSLVPKDYIKVTINGTQYYNSDKFVTNRLSTITIGVSKINGSTDSVKSVAEQFEVSIYAINSYDESGESTITSTIDLKGGTGTTKITLPNKIEVYYLSIESILILIMVI